MEVGGGLNTISSEILLDLTQEENGSRSSGSHLEMRYYVMAMTTQF